MPIRINCKHCGKKFSAWDDLVGKAVKCPKCQQEMMVPGGDAEMPGAPPPPPTKPASNPMSLEGDGFDLSVPPHSSAAPVTLGADDLVEPPMSGAYEPLPSAAKDDSFALPMPSVGTSKQAAPSTTETEDDLDDVDDLPFACPSCNQAMPPNEDLCDNCGYHRILQKKLDLSDGINKPDKSTGFERVFRGQLEDADSAQKMLVALKIAGAVAILVMLFICGWVGWVFAAIAVIGYLIYRKQLGGKTVTGDSEVNRDAFSSALWMMMLSIQRVIGWRQMAWPFPTTKALILHDSTFTDTDLAELQELADYQTLDLEGTQVSNEGLKKLQSMKELQYIVLLNTNVSAGGVQKLQQAIPNAWVWF